MPVLSFALALAGRFWPVLLVGGLLLIGWTYVQSVERQAYSRGYEQRKGEEEADARRRLDASTKAEQEAQRCAADPACRLQSDPYERKDE